MSEHILLPEGSIEKQTTDLLNELISEYPNIERTKSVLNNIHLFLDCCLEPLLHILYARLLFKLFFTIYIVGL